jgi:hypothetical protein
MRFLRYVFKQKAVNEICNMIAPPDQFTVVGLTGTVQAGHVSSAVTVDLFRTSSVSSSAGLTAWPSGQSGST